MFFSLLPKGELPKLLFNEHWTVVYVVFSFYFLCFVVDAMRVKLRVRTSQTFKFFKPYAHLIKYVFYREVQANQSPYPLEYFGKLAQKNLLFFLRDFMDLCYDHFRIFLFFAILMIISCSNFISIINIQKFLIKINNQYIY